jgi:hypothetical protein
MLIRLYGAVGVPGTRQQGVSSGRVRYHPIKLPASPRVPLNRVHEFCFGPGLAAVSADRDLSYYGLAGPMRRRKPDSRGRE